MSLQVLILALFFGLSLLPQGWNKVDNPLHATLIYLLAPLLVILLVSGWKKLIQTRLDIAHKLSVQNMIKISAIAIGILFAVAFIYSPVKNLGWSEVMVMACGISIFFLLQHWRQGEQKTLLRIIMIFAIIASFLGFYQYLFRPESRIAGPFFVTTIASQYWPNAFAMFLLSTWPLTLYFKFEPTNLVKRILNIVLPAIPLAALLLTFSRAAFLVLIVQLIICAWFSRNTLKEILRDIPHISWSSRHRIFAVAATILLTMLITSWLHLARERMNPHASNSFLAKATFSGTEQQTSFQERFDFMKGAIKLMPRHPLTGSGPFTFRFIYPQIQTDFLAVADHPHNWYLKIGLEEGIPALALFLIFLGGIAYTRRDIFTQGTLLDLPAILILSLMGPLLHNLADYNMNFMTNQMIFWIVLAVFFSPKKNADDEAQLTTAAQKSTPIFAIVLATAILILSGSIAMEAYNSLTKQYDKMMLTRNYYLDQASYKRTQSETERAAAAAQHFVSLNPYDAFGWNLYGHILEEQKDPKALTAYENALRSDPANFFNFYLDYFRLANRLHFTDTAAYSNYKTLALTFLGTYPQKILTNIHYTAQTGNAQQAIDLAKLLGQPQLSLRIKRALRAFQSEHPSLLSK